MNFQKRKIRRWESFEKRKKKTKHIYIQLKRYILTIFGKCLSLFDVNIYHLPFDGRKLCTTLSLKIFKRRGKFEIGVKSNGLALKRGHSDPKQT